MFEKWTPQRMMQKTSNMKKVKPEKSKQHHDRVFQWNQLLLLQKELSHIFKNLKEQNKGEKIIEIKYRRNLTFLGSRKIFECCMKNNTSNADRRWVHHHSTVKTILINTEQSLKRKTTVTRSRWSTKIQRTVKEITLRWNLSNKNSTTT